jgi:hypothetical protein
MKICLVCGAEFSPKRACGKKQLYCGIGCRKLAKKENDDKCKRRYEEEHREEIAKSRRERQRSPEFLALKRKQYNDDPKHRRQVRSNNIKYELGITIEEYEARREAQRLSGDLCGLCKQPLGNVDSTPNLDHDHETLQIRDFLHRSCNMALGLLKDDPKICRMAAEYLERHGKQCRTQFQKQQE